MNNPAMVGIDVGTSRTKCLIIEATGKILALASAATADFHPQPDWTDYDGEVIWQGVCGTIRSALRQIEDPSRVQAIAVARFAESAIPIDKFGQARRTRRDVGVSEHDLPIGDPSDRRQYGERPVHATQGGSFWTANQYGTCYRMYEFRRGSAGRVGCRDFFK